MSRASKPVASRPVARTANAPTVNGVGEYLGQDRVFYPQSVTYTLGLQMNWPIFDGGLTPARIREAEANLEETEASLKRIRQQVLSEVAQAWVNLRAAEQRVNTAQASVTEAEETLRISEARLHNGLGIYLEVSDAQSSLLQVKTNLVNAQSDLDVARVNLWHATGMTTLSPPAPPEETLTRRPPS